MKLAVSNIAWTNEEEAAVASLLRDMGVKYIEIAPTKKWDNPTQATAAEIDAYKAFWESYGITIVAFQSMLFTRPDLKLFESPENRQATLKYLQDFISLAETMCAGVMVFGSPKNRQRGELSLDEVMPVAKQFFMELGQTASSNGVEFCIEPNATQYACDFVTTAEEGISFVQEVATPGFGLHLDIACMTLADDDVSASILKAKDVIRHFHISSPMLEDVVDRPDVDHRAAAHALNEIGYNGYVSIEMKPAANGENLERVKRAVEFAQSVYA